MLVTLRRRFRARRRERLTVERCVANLRASRCAFNRSGEPCKRTYERGLLNDEDANVILVCPGHAGVLLEMRRDGRAERLLDALWQEFGCAEIAVATANGKETDDEVKVVIIG